MSEGGTDGRRECEGLKVEICCSVGLEDETELKLLESSAGFSSFLLDRFLNFQLLSEFKPPVINNPSETCWNIPNSFPQEPLTDGRKVYTRSLGINRLGSAGRYLLEQLQVVTEILEYSQMLVVW